MVTIVNALVFAWLALWAVYAISLLSKGHTHSALVVVIVHFIFCGVPLGLDVVVGPPDYSFNPGFRDASRDWMTNLVYCAYVAACPVLWWYSGVGRSTIETDLPQQTQASISGTVVQWLCYAILISPILAVLVAPHPGLYTTYAWSATQPEIATDATLSHHTLIAALCKLSVFAGAFLMLWQRRPRWLLLIVCLLVATWVDGKRHIVVFEVLVVCYALWRREYISSRGLWKAGIVAGVIIGGFSYLYQRAYRSDSLIARGWYENMRIDYGRDDVIKLAIYCELYPKEGMILDYRGQSVLFHLGTAIPRSMWPGKPETYATYVTARMLDIPVRRLGWGMTTSILEEAIANFSWFGMIIGPFVVSAVCRLGDSCTNSFVHLLTVLVGCLFIVVQLTAFYPIFMLWLGLAIYDRLRQDPSARQEPLVADSELERVLDENESDAVVETD